MKFGSSSKNYEVPHIKSRTSPQIVNAPHRRKYIKGAFILGPK